MYSCPIIYFQDNLIFGEDKSCWAVYKIRGFDYDLRSESSKMELHGRLTRFVANIPTEAKILLIPTNSDVDVHHDRLIRSLDPEDPLYDLAVFHANATRDYLKQQYSVEGGSANEYQAYVVVKLETENVELITRMMDLGSYFIADPVNAINTVMGLDTRDILESQIQHFKGIAAEFLQEQGQRISLDPTETIETQWLIRRGNYRGMREEVFLRTDMERTIAGAGTVAKKKSWTPFASKVKQGTQPAVRPYQKDIVTLFDGAVHLNEKRAIRIDHSSGSSSYQGFLAFTHIPDGMEFPGCEWLFLLQEYRVQCEICIHINNIEHRQALKKLDGKKREIKSQKKEIYDSGNTIPDDILDAEESAISLENELKQYRDPLSRASVTLCFSGETMDEMEAKLKYIRGVYTDFNFILERPLTDQYALYMGMIPGAGRYTADFILPLPPATIAGGIFGATRLLGDGIGPYIGTTGPLRQSVYLNMALAPLRNESAAATAYGNLGQGKSFNMNLLTYHTVLYGGRALIFCPKGERAHWETDFKFFSERGLITAITLSADDEFRGALDPFIIYRENVENACAIAQNLITEYFQIPPQDYRSIVLSKALEQMKRESSRSMSLLAKKLKQFPPDPEVPGLDEQAKLLAMQLETMQNIGMAKLLFGTGEEKGLDLSNRINILMVQNLKLPSPDKSKDDYDSEERLSTLLMSVMGSFAKKFALQDLRNSLGDPIFKLAQFDESWVFGRTSSGLDLISFLTRMGRSLNLGVILNGHSVLDIPTESIRETIKFKFCFKTDNEKEAIRMLEYMAMDVTEENIKRIKDLKNGECLFQDLDKRVGVLQFDVVFEDLKAIFSTTPGQRTKIPESAQQHLNFTEELYQDLMEEEVIR